MPGGRELEQEVAAVGGVVAAVQQARAAETTKSPLAIRSA
jgi:hypothetical protein